MATFLTINPDPLLARLDKLVTTNHASSFGVSGAIFGVSSADGREVIVQQGHDASGHLELASDTLVPIASASKLALGLLILRMFDEGVINIDEQLREYLPEAQAARHKGVTIKRLLSHTSGLPLEIQHELSVPKGSFDWRTEPRWPGHFAEACLNTELSTAPGEIVQYSNVAFGLLSLAAERVAGEDISSLLRTRIFNALDMEAYFGEVPPRPPMAIAGFPGPYVGTDFEPYNSSYFFKYAPPQAGIITTVSGLLKLVQAFGDRSTILKKATAQLARQDHTEGRAGGYCTSQAFLMVGPTSPITWDPCSWGLAVEVQGGKEMHWSSSSFPRSVGQVGSSGCLAWLHVESGVAWALAGARSTDSGWLIRHGKRIAHSALDAFPSKP